MLGVSVWLSASPACLSTCCLCRAYMTMQEVLAVAQAGVEQGCTEALFTLGALHFTTLAVPVYPAMASFMACVQETNLSWLMKRQLRSCRTWAMPAHWSM